MHKGLMFRSLSVEILQSIDGVLSPSGVKPSIDDYRVSFDVGNRYGGVYNGTVTMYNLSEEWINNLNTGNILKLSCGYRGLLGGAYDIRSGDMELDVLFVGNIQNSITRTVANNVITTITLLDKDRLNHVFIDSNNTFINKTFKEIVVDICKRADLTVDIRVSSSESANLEVPIKSITFDGTVFTALRKMCNKYGLMFVINSGIVSIHSYSDIKYIDDDYEYTKVNINTGMIGYPILDAITAGRVETLLDPSKVPFQYIMVESNAYVFGTGGVNLTYYQLNNKSLDKDSLARVTGDILASGDIRKTYFKSHSVRHIGDTRANTWKTVIDMFRNTEIK